MGCPAFEGCGNFAVAFADAGIVEEKDGTGLGKSVDEGWVPKVHVAAKVHEHD